MSSYWKKTLPAPSTIGSDGVILGDDTSSIATFSTLSTSTQDPNLERVYKDDSIILKMPLSRFNYIGNLVQGIAEELGKDWKWIEEERPFMYAERINHLVDGLHEIEPRLLGEIPPYVEQEDVVYAWWFNLLFESLGGGQDQEKVGAEVLDFTVTGSILSSTPQKIWFLVKEDGKCYLTRLDGLSSGSLYKVVTQLPSFEKGSIEMRGKWSTYYGHNRYYTEGGLYVAYIFSNGSSELLTINPDSGEITKVAEMDSGCTSIDFCSGWFNSSSQDAEDLGLVIGSVNNGVATYAQYYGGDLFFSSIPFAVNSGISEIKVSRLNDFRMVFSATYDNGDIKSIVTKRYFQEQSIEPEYFESAIKDVSFFGEKIKEVEFEEGWNDTSTKAGNTRVYLKVKDNTYIDRTLFGVLSNFRLEDSAGTSFAFSGFNGYGYKGGESYADLNVASIQGSSPPIYLRIIGDIFGKMGQYIPFYLGSGLYLTDIMPARTNITEKEPEGFATTISNIFFDIMKKEIIIVPIEVIEPEGFTATISNVSFSISKKEINYVNIETKENEGFTSTVSNASLRIYNADTAPV